MNFGILMLQGLVNSFGTTVMASFATAAKIDTIAYMPAQEFGNANSLFVSQNYGANKNKRIKKETRLAFVTSALFCTAISVLIWILADRLMGMFIDSAEMQIIAEGARYLRIEGAMYTGIGILFLWHGYFAGINKPNTSLILTVISLGTRVVLSYALAPYTPLGVMAIYGCRSRSAGFDLMRRDVYFIEKESSQWNVNAEKCFIIITQALPKTFVITMYWALKGERIKMEHYFVFPTRSTQSI